MPPIQRTGVGWVIVLLDVRVHGYDVVADPVGWLLIWSGLRVLAPRSPWFGRAAVAAAVTGVLSLVEYAPAFTGGTALAGAYNLVLASVIVSQAWGIRDAAGAAGEHGPAAQCRVIAWATVVIAGFLAAGLIGYYAAHGAAVSLVASMVFLALLVMIWFTLLQLLIAPRAYLRDPSGAAPAD
ncbi:MAG: hypothetical protein ACRDP1_02825 [Nocardioidaceae bacterium]